MNAQKKKGKSTLWPPSKAISSTGVIHEVVVKMNYGTITYHPACNETFDLGIDGFFAQWKGTERPATCRHCIRKCAPPVTTTVNRSK